MPGVNPELRKQFYLTELNLRSNRTEADHYLAYVVVLSGDRLGCSGRRAMASQRYQFPDPSRLAFVGPFSGGVRARGL